jgi:uncharacterized membrane protein
VFAVIITIMVLDLRPPPQATLAALLPLWPTALSYAVSYLFIAIVWVNHHHLLRFAEHATPRLIWVNFAHLFMVSLVPFSTAWVANTRLAAIVIGAGQGGKPLSMVLARAGLKTAVVEERYVGGCCVN